MNKTSEVNIARVAVIAATMQHRVDRRTRRHVECRRRVPSYLKRRFCGRHRIVLKITVSHASAQSTERWFNNETIVAAAKLAVAAAAAATDG